MAGPPTHLDQGLPAGYAPAETSNPPAEPRNPLARSGDMPGAPAFGSVDGGTMTSPAPGAPAAAFHTERPPPPVVVLSNEELAAARERQAAAYLEGAPEPARRGVAGPLVATLVAIAFTVGFVLGMVFERAR